MANLIPQMDNG